jgi:hypothetical protein
MFIKGEYSTIEFGIYSKRKLLKFRFAFCVALAIVLTEIELIEFELGEFDGKGVEALEAIIKILKKSIIAANNAKILNFILSSFLIFI